MAVPVQNVFYMLCYAWKRLSAVELTAVDKIEGDHVEALVAEVLLRLVERQLKRGLKGGYRREELVTRAPRGRLQLSATVRRGSLSSGRVVCDVGERTVDTLLNRILLASILRLSRCQDLCPERRALARRLAGHPSFAGVERIELDGRHFARVQLYGSLEDYGFMLRVCAWLHASMFPTTRGRKRWSFAGIRDKESMGLLFQAFLKSFLQLEQDWWDVRSRNFRWDAAALAESSLSLLPLLKTDICLQRDQRLVVVEVKFTGAPLSRSSQSRVDGATHSKTTFVPAHLNQLHVYLDAADPGGTRKTTGLLLYARVDRTLDHWLRMGPHRVWVRTLDMNQPWRGVKKDLLAISDKLRVPPTRFPFSAVPSRLAGRV